MSKKIESLTPEQVAKFQEYVKKFTDIGLCTDRIDREKAKIAVNEAYECGGLKAPSIYIFLDSPLAVQYGIVFLQAIFKNAKVRAQVSDQVFDQVSAQVRAQVFDQVRDQVSDQVFAQVSAQVRDQVGDQVFAQVRDQVRDQVFAQVSDQVSAQVRDQVSAQVRAQVFAQVFDQVRDQVSDQVFAQVSAQVRDQVGDQVFDQVSAQVRDQVFDQVRDQVFAQVRDQVKDYLYSTLEGNHNAGFASFYCFFIEQLKLKKLEKIKGVLSLVKNSGWVWLFPDVCFICDRHTILNLDESGRLHSGDGLACGYPDGWGIYAWHGVKTTEQIIMRPHEITSEMVLKENNSEMRRVMMERMGLRRYILESRAVVLDKDDHSINWKRALLKVGDDVMLFVADPSTGRNYPIQVDPRIKTCEQADRWIYQENKTWDGKEVKQLART